MFRPFAVGPQLPRPLSRIPPASTAAATRWTGTNPLLFSTHLAAADAARRIQAGSALGTETSLAPRIPMLAAGASGSIAPGLSVRLYRMRPRTPVAWAGLSAFNTVPAGGPAGHEPTPRVPDFARRELGLGLRELRRPYRMRAGGPSKAASLASWLPLDAVPEAGLGTASLPPLPPAAVPLLRPRLVERLFRSRPRAGIGEGPGFAALDADAGAFNPDAAIPVAPLSNTGPSRVERLFKARPRAGIDDARLALFEIVQPRPVQPSEMLRMIPASACVPLAISAEPPQLTRAFRMRPRAGIQDARLPVFEIVQPRAAQPAEMLRVLPTSDCMVAAISAEPPQFTRAFRMRPRAGRPGRPPAGLRNRSTPRYPIGRDVAGNSRLGLGGAGHCRLSCRCSPGLFACGRGQGFQTRTCRSSGSRIPPR